MRLLFECQATHQKWIAPQRYSGQRADPAQAQELLWPLLEQEYGAAAAALAPARRGGR